MNTFWLIFKPETNWFRGLRDELKSVVRQHARVIEERSAFLSEELLDKLYADSYPRAPKSYSREEILWIHDPKWGSSLLLLIETDMLIPDFRKKVVGGHDVEPHTLRGIWKLQRDNSLNFWRARGLSEIPTHPDQLQGIPKKYWSHDRLSLLLNGIHCPKDEVEAQSDTQAFESVLQIC